MKSFKKNVIDRITLRSLAVIVFVIFLLLMFSVKFISSKTLAKKEIFTKNSTYQSLVSNEKGSIVDRRGVEFIQDSHDESVIQLLSEIKSTDLVNSNDVTKITIDNELQSFVYRALEEVVTDVNYAGGAGVVMDINTGEVLVMTSYSDTIQSDSISINKVTNGLYIPGSVIKPFVAIAALSEEIISPEKEILSTGSIELPDPYKGGSFLVFKDWKVHGYVDMRKAIGVSSNVYFYAVGGGYENQRGLGIEKIEEYLRLFGFGNVTGIAHLTESGGLIPNPEWKEKKFNSAWRLGDTYLASIGQHEYEVTPLQLVRAIAAIANDGQLVIPTIVYGNKISQNSIPLAIKKVNLKIVREGMEYAVINGTASGLYMDDLSVAAKTGTAEVDIYKKHIHSWVTGYFPYDNPKYAFTFFLEKGPWGEETGAVVVAHDVLTWIRDNRPEYFTQF